MNKTKALLYALALLAPGLPAAQIPPQWDDLDQRLKIAERKLELAGEDADKAKKENATLAAGANGFALQSADKKFSLKLGGLLQIDSRTYIGDILVPLTNDILVRRARLIANTVLGERLKGSIVLDLAGASPSLVDAFADLKLGSWASLRLGRFKTPISLENFRSDPARDFVEAAFPLGLATVRDTGAWLELADPDQAVSLGLGLFNGGGDGATVTGDTNDAKDVVAKLFIHPTRFLDTVVLRDLGIGVAGSSGNRAPGTAPATYKSTGQQTLSGYKALTTLRGGSARIAPQAYLFQGPFSFLGEYIRSQDFGSNSTNANDYRSAWLERDAWQVSAAWVLTGEDASFNGLKWNPETTQPWGVWQIVARYQELQYGSKDVTLQDRTGVTASLANQRFLDPRSTPTKVQGWGIGLNWLATPNTKIYLDFDQNLFTNGAKTGTGAGTRTQDKETENTLFVRTQFSY